MDHRSAHDHLAPLVPTVRWSVDARVPELIRRAHLPAGHPGLPRRLAPRPGHRAVGLLEPSEGRLGVARPASPAACASPPRRLGPTYIKLGQIISSGEGIFPEELVDEFKKCRDQVPPEPFDVGPPGHRGGPRPAARGGLRVASTASRSPPPRSPRCTRPRCAPASRWWSRCSARRCSSSSTSTSRSWRGWRPFLVGRIPITALANPPALVELFAETIAEELDFRLEADNMLDVAARLRRARPAGLRRPPSPPHARDPAGAGHGAPRRASPSTTWSSSTDAGIDSEDVVRTGMIGFMEGAMLYGIFHGDLHGGNLLVLPDGRIGLLDYGITGRLDEQEAAGVPAPARRRHDERRAHPARGVPRPRRPPGRHRPRPRSSSSSTSTSRRSTRRR